MELRGAFNTMLTGARDAAASQQAQLQASLSTAVPADQLQQMADTTGLLQAQIAGLSGVNEQLAAELAAARAQQQGAEAEALQAAATLNHGTQVGQSDCRDVQFAMGVHQTWMATFLLSAGAV